MVGLYVHVPWCVKKCPYCDFNSHEATTFDEQGYVDKLIRDFRSTHLRINVPIDTVYIGGGTPSLFQPDSYQRMLDALGLCSTPEITMEANPGTLERSQLAQYRRAGITRLSLGIQSLDDDKLTQIGRIHNSSEAVTAIGEAMDAGFDSVNVDLMYGLPAQSIQDSLHDLEKVIAAKPQHISWYQLTIEPNTYFHAHPPVLASADYSAEMSAAGLALLQSSGYARYEVSAFAKPGFECRHNLNYWQFGDYIGIGAGAHGKLRIDGELVRTRWHKHPRTFLTKDRYLVESIDREHLPVEFMMNVLRLAQGVCHDLFTSRTRLPLAQIQSTLDELISERLMQQNRLALTEFGYGHLDTVVERFLPANA